MIAYDYPILGLFWTVLIICLWVGWLLLLFRVITDIFRRSMSGVAKAVWAIFVLVFPLVGVIAYLIVNGGAMEERAIEDAKEREAALQQYLRNVAGSTGGTADELTKLADLHGRGILTDDEFAGQKAKLLAR